MISLWRCSRSRAAARRSVDPGQLALELAPGGNPLRVELGADGAARLAVVAAVREAAVRSQRVDVGEAVAGAIPQAGHADAWRIDQERPAGQRRRLARRRGVAAAQIARRGASLVFWRCSPRRALTSVDLQVPDAPSRTAVVPGHEQRAHDVQALAGERADGEGVGPAESARELPAVFPAVVGQVGLGQHERGGPPPEAASAAKRSAGAPSDRQRLGHQRQVDVRGGPSPARRHRARGARSCRLLLEHGGDYAAVVEPDPVAGDRRLGRPPAGGTSLISSSDATSHRPRYCASTRTRASRNATEVLHSSSQRARRGAGTRRVGQEPVQAVVAKMKAVRHGLQRCGSAGYGYLPSNGHEPPANAPDRAGEVGEGIRRIVVAPAEAVEQHRARGGAVRAIGAARDHRPRWRRVRTRRPTPRPRAGTLRAP